MPSAALRVSTSALIAALLSTACSEPSVPPVRPPKPLSAPPEKADTRFMRIRTLLELPPQSRRRATELYGLVAPLCTDAAAGEDFLATMKWSTDHGDKTFYLPIELALDVLEHVALACARRSVDGTLELLRGAEVFLPEEGRLQVLIARTLAASGRLDEARLPAKKAVELGSAHAVALFANIQARAARDAEVGWRPGMLDPAIHTASTEPTASWHAIDLAAVLSTRARLLLEKGLWSGEAEAATSRDQASEVLERIVRGPFPHEVRGRAADAACFEAAELERPRARAICTKAAQVYGHLGAAQFAGVEAPIDQERSGGLALLKARLHRFEPGTLVPVVFRGDEQELLEWARPASRLLFALRAREARLLVVDRSSSARASALVSRILSLSGVDPWRRIDARKGTFSVPCLAALLADRSTPPSCPLGAELTQALLEEEPPPISFLVGRDLDAEIDDLRLYEHEVALMSFRRSEMEKKGLAAWLKSLSDVLVLTGAP